MIFALLGNEQWLKGFVASIGALISPCDCISLSILSKVAVVQSNPASVEIADAEAPYLTLAGSESIRNTRSFARSYLWAEGKRCINRTTSYVTVI